MFRNSIKIGKLYGIEIRIDPSWLIIFFLISFSFSFELFPALYPQLSATTNITLGIVTALLFFASVIVHELSHSIYAKRHGIKIPRITLFLLGGVAELQEEPKTPKDELFMALAGPLASYVIALLFGGLWYLAAVYDLLSLQVISATVATINVAVATFNLIPAFPLDGGRVLRSIIWHFSGKFERSTYWASWTGRVFSYLLLLYGIIQFLLGSIVGGLWFFILSWFLYNAAVASYQQVLLKKVIGNKKVKDMMQEADFSELKDNELSPNDSFMKAVDLIRSKGKDIVYVGNGNNTVGFITRDDIRSILNRKSNHKLTRGK